MRRNRDFGNHQQQSPGGPLLTNHLRDLDIELQLLKRKRDIIQQEQNMLNRYSSKRQYDYEQPSSTYGRQESNNHQLDNDGLSYGYAGPSNSGSYARPPASKRQTPNQYWQAPTAAKRLAGGHKINPWQNPVPKQESGFSSRKNFQPQNFPTQVKPLMNIRPNIGQRIRKNFPTSRKDFKPTKVTKSKSQPQNKATNLSSGETKKLVSHKHASDKKSMPDQILRADKTPTAQMKGRLELALGTILKEIKTDSCTDPKNLEYFQSPFIQRLLKHTIRTRIRNVMIDQVVSNVTDIVGHYRKKFPKESDNEILQIAKDAQNLTSQNMGVIQLIESDDPYEFYKKNVTKVLNTKLEQMFDNLEKLYLNKSNKIEESIDKLPEPKVDNEQEKKVTPNDEDRNYDNEKINFENVGEGNIIELIKEKSSKAKIYMDFMDEMIEQRLPKILPKYKDMLLSIIFTDGEFFSTRAMIMSQLKKKMIKSFEKVMSVPAPKPSDENSLKTTTAESTTTETNETTALSIPSVSPILKSEPEVIINETAIESSETSVHSSAVEQSASITATDSVANKDTISSEIATPVKSSTDATLNADATPATPNKPSAAQNTSATTVTPELSELYYVKLISRPSLPARAVIYDFLNKFNPTSIKKHKSINNLLVIGLTNKEDYEKILTVNESAVGNAIITIKASDQVNKTKQANESVSKSADQSLSDDSLITSDLDHQITDLLASIRKTDETIKHDPSDKKGSDNKMDTSETTKEDNPEAPTAKDVSDQKEKKINVATSDENITKNDKKLITPENDGKVDKKVEKCNTDKNNENLDSDKCSEKIDTTARNEETDTAEKNKNKSKEEGISHEKDLTKVNKNDDNSKSEEERNKKELEMTNKQSDEDKNESEINKVKPDGDKIKDNLRESGKGTPRTSSRIASSTPSTIRTRRANKLAQNNEKSQ